MEATRMLGALVFVIHGLERKCLAARVVLMEHLAKDLSLQVHAAFLGKPLEVGRM